MSDVQEAPKHMYDDVPLEDVIDFMFPVQKEHVVWTCVIDPSPEFTVPFPVYVWIFDTQEHLQEACSNPKAGAFSSTLHPRGGKSIGAVIFLSKEGLELSLVAHEATHIALHHHGYEHGRGGAKRWMENHPESVAEMVGNMTAFIWYGIPTAEEIDEAEVND